MYNIWKLPFDPYTLGSDAPSRTERIVEMPWATTCVAHANRVLDVGCAYSEGRYFEALRGIGIQELYGVDFSRIPQGSVEATKNLYKEVVLHDIRLPLPFGNDFFDAILCISTIEHVGFRYRKYNSEGAVATDSDGQDIVAMQNLLKVLHPDGILVLTVPYGKRGKFLHFKQYNKDGLNELIDKSGAIVEHKDIFSYNGAGWSLSSDENVKDKTYGKYGYASASALACLILRRA